MAISAEHRSKFGALHRSWWRLRMSEKFSSGTKTPNKHLTTAFYYLGSSTIQLWGTLRTVRSRYKPNSLEYEPLTTKTIWILTMRSLDTFMWFVVTIVNWRYPVAKPERNATQRPLMVFLICGTESFSSLFIINSAISLIPKITEWKTIIRYEG